MKSLIKALRDLFGASKSHSEIERYIRCEYRQNDWEYVSAFYKNNNKFPIRGVTL